MQHLNGSWWHTWDFTSKSHHPLQLLGQIPAKITRLLDRPNRKNMGHRFTAKSSRSFALPRLSTWGVWRRANSLIEPTFKLTATYSRVTRVFLAHTRPPANFTLVIWSDQPCFKILKTNCEVCAEVDRNHLPCYIVRSKKHRKTHLQSVLHGWEDVLYETALWPCSFVLSSSEKVLWWQPIQEQKQRALGLDSSIFKSRAKDWKPLQGCGSKQSNYLT